MFGWLGMGGTSNTNVQEVVHAIPKLQIEEIGEKSTFSYRVQAKCKEQKNNVSMWHDIKLFPTPDSRSQNIVNMINEIPRCSRKKYEIATNEPGNPIKQDVKKGQLREFSKGDLYFNYGCLPRTWEDPDHEHHDAKAKGDNDPLDVCEIGLRIFGVAEVVPVKVLGCLCLIDEGEADWKLIAIAITDPWAPYLNDVTDLEQKLPGLVDAIREWFRTYKIPDGKPENKFGLEGRCMNAEYAMAVVEETHESWKKLVLGELDEDLPPPPGDSAPPVQGGGMKRNLSAPKLNLDDLNQLEPTTATADGIKRNISYPKLNLADLAE